jgi:hypothetical protein
MRWYKALPLISAVVLVNSCTQQETIEKTFHIETEPSGANLYLDGKYVGSAPTDIHLKFKGPEDAHIIEAKKYNYKSAKKIITPETSSEILITLQREEKRKLGYLIPTYKEGTLSFSISYEYGYYETIEKSPNALQVRRIVSLNNVNQLIGSMDVKAGKLVYTLITPAVKINADIYIRYLELLRDIQERLQNLIENPSKATASELASYISVNEKELKELLQTAKEVFGTKIDPEEVLANLKQLTGILMVFPESGKISYKIRLELKDLAKKFEEIRNALEVMKTNEFFSELWMIDLKKGFIKTKLTDSQHKWIDMTPSLSADGKWVYYSSNRLSPDFDIWRISTKGGIGITRIINSRYTQDLHPSVDGKNYLLAYSSIPIGSIQPQIWTARVDGTLPSQLRVGDQPNLCRDGKKIVFVRKNEQTGKYQIWLMNSDGTGETVLSQDPTVNDMYPYFSPDCKWIVFTSDAGGNKDIYIMKVDGSHRTQLTTNPSVDIYPVWGDDGYIYFVSNRGLVWGIWSLKPALEK